MHSDVRIIAVPHHGMVGFGSISLWHCFRHFPDHFLEKPMHYKFKQQFVFQKLLYLHGLKWGGGGEKIENIV